MEYKKTFDYLRVDYKNCRNCKHSNKDKFNVPLECVIFHSFDIHPYRHLFYQEEMSLVDECLNNNYRYWEYDD